jgi:hypothetical protein
LFAAGNQVPLTPLADVPGSEMAPPEHIGETALKVGITEAPTPTVIVTVDAHCPVLGVKV